jgi:hypothetical protein
MKLAALFLATLPLFTVAAPAFSAPAVVVAYSDYATLISTDYDSPINVRDGASTGTYARHIGYAGDRVEILDRMAGEDGYMWFFVRFTSSNATGWVRGDYVSLD